jgi:hypothetical protein
MTKSKHSADKAPAAWNLSALIVALLVCAVLGIAAYAKIVDPNKAKFITIGGSDFAYERAIGIFEVLVILALLAGHRLRLAWLGVLVMFATFAGYAGYYAARGVSCGCFGTALNGTPLEWMTVRGVSVGFDVLFVVLALILLNGRGFGAKAIQGLVGLALMLTAVGGFLGSFEYANYQRALERAEERTKEQIDDREELAPGLRVGAAPAILLRQDEFAEVVADTAENPGKMWYIFVYDPDCSECMEMKPIVDMLQQQYEEDETSLIQVMSYTKQDAQEKHNIDFWSWKSGATVILVQDGDILKVYDESLTPDGKPYPDEVMEEFYESGAIEGDWPPAGE